MNHVYATFRDGQVVLDSPVQWQDGTRLEVQPAPAESQQPAGVEFDELLDELAEIGEATITPNTPPLSDHAVSRAGIYGDHP